MVAREIDLPTIHGGKEGEKRKIKVYLAKEKVIPSLLIPNVFPDTPATHSKV